MAEFDRAEKAREENNEGRARVCARRAAGIAAREYLNRRGQKVRTRSAYDLLKILVDDPDLPPDTRLSASNLLLQVNVEFKLPPGIDLLKEAKNLCRQLFADF